jgi:hypothetical protein
MSTNEPTSVSCRDGLLRPSVRTNEPTAAELKAELDRLEAERVILTIELRNELVRAAKQLLPEALRQARQGRQRGKKQGRNPNPALLRLISRLAMRPIHLDRSHR